MRLALWTPRAAAPWAAAIVEALRSRAALAVVGAEPGRRPEVDLDLYDVADDPAHAFVYRALVERPGLVLLQDWSLHTLVRAATAGRGDEAAYLREARRAHGETGAFVARQVARGLGGVLPSLLPLNERVIERSLGVLAWSGPLAARVAGSAPDRPLLTLPLESCAPTAAAEAILALAGDALLRLPEALAAQAAERRAEASPAGRARFSLRPSARELGLRDLPDDVGRLVEGLFAGGGGMRP